MRKPVLDVNYRAFAPLHLEQPAIVVPVVVVPVAMPAPARPAFRRVTFNLKKVDFWNYETELPNVDEECPEDDNVVEECRAPEEEDDYHTKWCPLTESWVMP